jgi:hypothetical protein
MDRSRLRPPPTPPTPPPPPPTHPHPHPHPTPQFDPYFNYRVTQFLAHEGFYNMWDW